VIINGGNKFSTRVQATIVPPGRILDMRIDARQHGKTSDHRGAARLRRRLWASTTWIAAVEGATASTANAAEEGDQRTQGTVRAS